MKRFIGVMFVLCAVCAMGCSKVTGTKDVYYVMFPSQPTLHDAKVYYVNKPMGEILQKEKIAFNNTKLTLFIEKDFRDMIKDNTIFYEDGGRLYHGSLGNFGKVVPPHAKLLGFDSKGALYWFKTKTLLSRSPMAARRLAEQLFRRGEEKR
jgi:hypothetical protein